jgi:hypothetical protein
VYLVRDRALDVPEQPGEERHELRTITVAALELPDRAADQGAPHHDPNNLVVGLEPDVRQQGVGKVLQIWDVSNLTIEHNTAFGVHARIFVRPSAATGVVIRNNVVAGCYPVSSGAGKARRH